MTGMETGGHHERTSRQVVRPVDPGQVGLSSRMTAGTFLPVWPLVIDTNVLRQEVLRRIRRPGETRMASGMRMQTIRVMTASHVVAEMDEHIREFAEKDGLSADEADRIWRCLYRHTITVVEVGGLLPAHPLVRAVTDEDDVPLGTLAALLGVRALSVDRDLGDLASGSDWLKHIVAATDMGLGRSVLEAAATGIYGLARGTYLAIDRLYGYLADLFDPMTARILLALAGGGALLALLHEPTRTRLIQSEPARAVASGGHVLLNVITELVFKGQQGDEYLREVALLDHAVTPEMSVARTLGTARQPLELHEIAALADLTLEEAEDVLGSAAAFTRGAAGEWQLGSRLPVDPALLPVMQPRLLQSASGRPSTSWFPPGVPIYTFSRAPGGLVDTALKPRATLVPPSL